MVKWQVTYWAAHDDTTPLEVWLDHRTPEQLKGLAKEIALLEQCGNLLRLPHSKSLGQGLFELRERMYGYRIYYAFSQNQSIVLLHAGDKTTQKRDIRIARDRLSQLI